MPDMSLPGSHLESLLDHFQFQQEDHYRKSKDHALMADVYQEAAHRLKRALEEERSKANPRAEPK